LSGARISAAEGRSLPVAIGRALSDGSVEAARSAARTPQSAAPKFDTATMGDIVEWDVRSWSAAFDFWRRHSTIDLRGCRALEIGSRGGGLSLWLALQGASVVCSDVIDPEEAAVSKHRRYGVSHLVTYERIDALQIPYTAAFDIVAFKSVLGAVGRYGRADRQAAAIRQMHNALKPGGELLFAENLAASWVHRRLRSRFVRWGGTWRYVAVDELAQLLAPFTQSAWQASGVLGNFGRTERQRAALAALDAALFNRITPPAWRYIAMGIARK
jgi:SAM-dependent methyltransferase